MLLGMLITSGSLKEGNIDAMTLQFYSPIYLLLTLCDREPSREGEALKLLELHIRQFARIYKGR